MTQTHIARAKCGACQEIITSEGGGRFASCKCGKSFIDQERWEGRYIRMGGLAEFIDRICPENCKIEEHKQVVHSL